MVDHRSLASHAPRTRTGLLLAAACAVLCAVVSACNTTEGVGKDVKSLGEGIEETAQDAKD